LPIEATTRITVNTYNGGGQVNLTWSPVVGAAAYRIYRSADGGKSYELVSTRLTKNFNGKIPYFNDSVANGSYTYAVRAYDPDLSKDTRGNAVMATATINVLATPAVTATKLSADHVYLTWNVITGAAAYKVYRSADGGKSYKLVATRLTKNFLGTPPYFNDTALSGGSYTYAVRAYDSAFLKSTRSAAGTATATINVLATPTVTATATENGVNLTWNAVDGAASYHIYRSADGGQAFERVSWLLAENFGSSTPYFNDTAVSGGSYIYGVRASNYPNSNVHTPDCSDAGMATVTV
jgi:fibronectin type 3 domain-containing protein